MKLRYTAEAHEHIRSIGRYIAKDKPLAAQSVVRRIRVAAERLRRNPGIGHEGADPETLEWVVVGLPYIIVYEVRPERDEVWVIAVFHDAQLR